LEKQLTFKRGIFLKASNTIDVVHWSPWLHIFMQRNLTWISCNLEKCQ